MGSSIAGRRFVAATGLVSRRVGGETILVPITSGVGDLDAVYTLSEVGSRVWSMLQSPSTPRAIGAALAQEYDVAEEDAIRDVQAFITELTTKRLVHETDGA